MPSQLLQALDKAVTRLYEMGGKLPADVERDYCSIKARNLIGQNYDELQAGYAGEIYGAMVDYLDSDASVTRFRNTMRRAVLEYFDATFTTGYIDGGGDPDKMSAADRNWLIARQDKEIGFVDELFQRLKTMRADAEKAGEELHQFAHDRAAGYSQTLESVYYQGKARGSGDPIGQWKIGATQEHCETCQKLADDEPHPVSWFISQGYIPREPGSQTLDCHGYNCDCGVYDKEGNRLL